MQSIAANTSPPQASRPVADSSPPAQSASDDASAGAANFAQVLRGEQVARSGKLAQSDQTNAGAEDPMASAPAASTPNGDAPLALSPDIAAALAQFQHGLAAQARGADSPNRISTAIEPGASLRTPVPQATAGEIGPLPSLATPAVAAPAGPVLAGDAGGAAAKTLQDGAPSQSAGVRAPHVQSPTSPLAAAAAAGAETAHARADAAQAGLPAADKAATGGAVAESAAPRAEIPVWANFAVPVDATATRQAAPVQHSPVIDAPVGSQRFADETAQQVTWMARNGVSEAEIRVKPAELGPISVRIEMNQNEAIINFAVTQPETRAAVEDAMHRLQEMLAESGISLGEANVGGQGFAQQSRNNGGGTRSHVIFPAGNAAGAVNALLAPARLAATHGRGVVDTFA